MGKMIFSVSDQASRSGVIPLGVMCEIAPKPEDFITPVEPSRLLQLWHRFGYRVFPSHRKELDNINKVAVDLSGDLSNSLVREEALKQKLRAAESAFQRPPAPQKAKTAAEVRRLMETQGQTEGEEDGV